MNQEQPSFSKPPNILRVRDEILEDSYYQETKLRKSQKWKDFLPVRCLFLFFTSFTVDRASIRGENYVSQKAEKESQLLASTASIANLIGTLGVAPVIYIVMAGMGPLSIPLALTLAYLLNSTQNCYVISVARSSQKKGNKDKSGLLGLISMQVLLTCASVIGMLLINSQNELAYYHGRQLVEAKREEVFEQKRYELASREASEIRRQCEQGKKDIEDAETPEERDRYITLTHGSYAATEALGVASIPDSYCGEWKTLREDIKARYRQILAAHEAAVSKGIPSLIILKELYPDTYDRVFQDDLIVDGNTSIAVAFSYSGEMIIEGDFSALGSGILFFFISLITSSALVIGIVAYSHKFEIKLSFSEEAKVAVRQFFGTFLHAEYREQAEKDAQSIVSSYYHEHVKRGGVVAIPSLETVMNYAIDNDKDLIELNSDEERKIDKLLYELDVCVHYLRSHLHGLATRVFFNIGALCYIEFNNTL